MSIRHAVLVVALGLGLVAAMAGAGVARAAPVEFLPVRHPAYDEIETLAAQGLLDSLQIYSRPLARIDVAAALLRARRLHPEVARSLHYQRLQRELARELEDLGTPPEKAESPLLLDRGRREERVRLSGAGHLRGDFDDKREAAHFRLRDETSVTMRGGVQVWPGFAAFEEIGITRIRGQRPFIDAIVAHTDLEVAVLRAELTARAGPLAAAAGYDMFRWGPGRRGTLLLADAAGPMGFLTFTGSFAGRVTATALTGVLSRADRRYLAAHRIEAALSPSVTLGLGEAVRYPSDNIDLLYATGLLPYAIVERIHIRDASTDSVRGGERANIMASLDLVVRPSAALSLYGELLLDDVATENSNMPDRIAYQLGLRSSRPYGSHTAHILAEYTRVRRFTYATEYGQSFIHRERPLGFVLGPDVEAVWMEVGLDLSRDWGVRWSGEFTNKGEGVLGEAWMESQGFVSNAGLFGIVEKRREVWGDLRWMPRDQVDARLGLGYRRVTNDNHQDGVVRTAFLGRVALDVRY